MRVDQHRQVRPAEHAAQPVDTGGVIEVTVTADDRLDRRRVELQSPEILGYAVRTGAGVEQERVLTAGLADGDQGREAVLGDQAVGYLSALRHRRRAGRDPSGPA